MTKQIEPKAEAPKEKATPTPQSEAERALKVNTKNNGSHIELERKQRLAAAKNKG